jgi:hypothetical protein
MWKQRAIRHADIAEEPFDPIKKGAKVPDVITHRDIFARKALAKRVIRRALWASCVYRKPQTRL